MTDFASRLRNFFGNDEFVPLHEPKFNAVTSKYVQECVDTGWVSTSGKFVGAFEKEVAEYVGAKHAVAVSSGTSALHLSLLVAGVSHGDEVICPDITFVASANAITYLGAVPHFVDVALDDMCIDVDKLEAHLAANTRQDGGVTYNRHTGRRIPALLAVHAFGFSADTKRLLQICSQYHLELVEDAACAIGAKEHGAFIGVHSKFATFSFNGNKVITGGAGGIVLTRDDEVQRRIKHLSTTAKAPHKWEYIHDDVGYNYRMPNINAAILMSQLEGIEQIIKKKRQLVENYKALLNGEDGMALVLEKPHMESNYWLVCLRLAEPSQDARDDLLERLNSLDIMARPLWRPISQLEPFKNAPRGDLTNSKILYNQIINIPSSPHLAHM